MSDAKKVAIISAIFLGIPVAAICDSASPANETTGSPAAPIVPKPRIIQNPRFKERPDGADVERFYPPGARRKGISGRVTVQCAVAIDGRPTNCGVVSEEPLGEGFGAAATALAKTFKLLPKNAQGVPNTGGVFEFSLQFRPAGH